MVFVSAIACECECANCADKPVSGFIIALNTPCCWRVAGVLEWMCVSFALATLGPEGGLSDPKAFEDEL